MSTGKTVIIIAGPTAVGKTAVALSLAKHFQTEIISADSRQCFKELKIGVARPSEEELKEVTHHFVASHSIKENINAAYFEQYALKKVHQLFQKKDFVVMVGGTGLYIKAFCEGLDEIPGVKPKIRSGIIEKYKENGLRWLQEEIRKKDPAFFAKGEIQNPQRMMRALEVMESSGQSILSYRKSEKVKRDFKIIKIGLELPREELYHNINSRVDKMIEEGLVNEVISLLRYRDSNALQTVGYKEIIDTLIPQLRISQLGEDTFVFKDDVLPIEMAIEEIKKNTRHYAKRQMTWFRKDKEIQWCNARQVDEIISMAQKLGNTF